MLRGTKTSRILNHEPKKKNLNEVRRDGCPSAVLKNRVNPRFAPFAFPFERRGVCSLCVGRTEAMAEESWGRWWFGRKGGVASLG